MHLEHQDPWNPMSWPLVPPFKSVSWVLDRLKQLGGFGEPEKNVGKNKQSQRKSVLERKWTGDGFFWGGVFFVSGGFFGMILGRRFTWQVSKKKTNVQQKTASPKKNNWVKFP